LAAIITDRWRWGGSVALLTLLYLLLRTTGLDRIVTTDEPFWLGRSANFYRALWQGDLVHTFQHAHPGVMTMWAGMVGYWFAAPGYVDTVDADIYNVYGIHRHLREMGLLEMDVLVASRIAKIVLQALLFALSLVWLRRLFGTPVAIVAGAIIALDPFLIAHDRLLHLDGLLAISSLAAVLALAEAATGSRRPALTWLIAGALAAVTWLTRSTGLALLGVVGLVLLTDAIAGD
jgi:dolichyl-phosphate-mannose--protein O-mannosyl transferase